jgi:hypothetical protein
MKRLVVLALLLLVMASAAFALDKAIGFGGMYNHSFSIGFWEDQGYYNSYGNLEYYDTDWTISRNSLGGFVFFGLGRYFELNAGFLYKNPINLRIKLSDGRAFEADLDLEPALALQGGIYFKYPFSISDTFVFFPTAGVDFEYTIYSEEEGWWNDIWLRGGVGLDIFFTQRMFLRAHLIYGAAFPVGADESWGINFSHGALGKIGIGLMF